MSYHQPTRPIVARPSVKVLLGLVAVPILPSLIILAVRTEGDISLFAVFCIIVTGAIVIAPLAMYIGRSRLIGGNGQFVAVSMFGKREVVNAADVDLAAIVEIPSASTTPDRRLLLRRRSAPPFVTKLYLYNTDHVVKVLATLGVQFSVSDVRTSPQYIQYFPGLELKKNWLDHHLVLFNVVILVGLVALVGFFILVWFLVK